MRNWMIALLMAPLAALAADGHDAAALKKDIERHRAMAAAHEQMAACLQGGQKYDACQKQLQAACRGLGIGKYCGMRHDH